MKTQNYKELEQWIEDHSIDLQLRPNKYLAVALPSGIIAEEETLSSLKVALSGFNQLKEPCFIINQRCDLNNRGQS